MVHWSIHVHGEERVQVIMTRASDVTDGEMTQFKSLLAKVGLTAEDIRAVNQDKTGGRAGAMVAALREYLVSQAVPFIADWAEEYKLFYREVFNREVDLSNVQIPDEQPGFGWVVIMLEGLTLNQIWVKCQEQFKCYSDLGDDLDKAVPKHDRELGKTYAKRFRDRIEADEENKNLSANMLAKLSILGITLPERLIQGLWYHWKTGEHLDRKNETLCQGSRSSDGRVPDVCWYGGKLYVHYCHPDNCLGDIRARSAV